MLTSFCNIVRNSVPFYLLVVMYAVHLFLHVTEQFLRGTSLSLCLLLVTFRDTVLL
jgi:hypothetical protein